MNKLLLALLLFLFPFAGSCSFAEKSPVAGSFFAHGEGHLKTDGNLVLTAGDIAGEAGAFIPGTGIVFETVKFSNGDRTALRAVDKANGIDGLYAEGEPLPKQFRKLFLNQDQIDALSEFVGWPVTFQGEVSPDA